MMTDINSRFVVGADKLHANLSASWSDNLRGEEALKRRSYELELWNAELQQRNRDLSLLIELQQLLQTCLDLEEAYAVFARFAPELFPGTSGALYIANQKHNLMVAAASWGQQPPAEMMFGPDSCWALRRGRTHVLENAGTQLTCRHLGQREQKAPQLSICVPMMAGGEISGVLSLGYSGGWPDSGDWAAARQQFAQTVAEQVALILANLRLRDTLRSQAIRDPLTGLFNRRYMEETLVRELHRSVRRKTQLGVVLLDIDFFKNVNDQHGHAAGDAVLRELGRFLQEHTRGEDIACRYGGEEFILILPDSSLESTRQRAEQLRSAVKHVTLHSNGRVIGPITLSLGVASYARHGNSVDALLTAADRALYQAKSSGRDKVIVATAA